VFTQNDVIVVWIAKVDPFVSIIDLKADVQSVMEMLYVSIKKEKIIVQNVL